MGAVEKILHLDLSPQAPPPCTINNDQSLSCEVHVAESAGGQSEKSVCDA